MVGQLAGAGSRAGAVYADYEDGAGAFTVGRTGNSSRMQAFRAVGSVQYAHNVRLDFGLELRGVGKRVAVQFLAHSIENLPRGADTQISRNQRRLELLEQRWINLLFTQENRVGSFGQRRLGF